MKVSSVKKNENLEQQFSDYHLQRLDAQNLIYNQYSKINGKSVTHFIAKSGAYPYTNEPLSNILNTDLNVNGPVMSVTASGDAIILFAGLGAKDIRAVDVSDAANAWAEYKWASFLAMDYEEFGSRMVRGDTPWSKFPFEVPVSRKSKKLFEHGKKKDGAYMHDDKLFQGLGFACPNPNSSGFATDKNSYQKIRKSIKDTSVLFYPTDLVHYFINEKMPNDGFTSVYLSNVLDHTRNPKGTERDFSEGRLKDVLKPIISHLHKDGQILFNFQWGDRAVPGSRKALEYFGYDLSRIKGNASGCGAMYVSKRK